MQSSPAFSQALQAARTFSISHSLNYVSSQLICCAAVEHSPAEDAFLGEEDKAIFLRKLFANILEQPKAEAPPSDEIPLTQDARVHLNLALQYMHAFGEEALDIPHYLLAILSADTKATKLLKERGWVFRNYLDWLTARKGVTVDFPDQLYPSTDLIPRRRKMGFFQRMFNKTAKQVEGREYLEDSMSLTSYKDYERAYQSAALAAEHAVRNEAYYLVKSSAEIKTRRIKEAKATIAESKKKGISNDHLFLNEAYCHYELGDYDRCVSICDAYLASTGHAPDTLNMMGFALAKQEQHNEAIASFDKTLQLDPENAMAMTGKGYSLFALGQIDAGIDWLNAALRIDKGNSFAYRNLALIADSLGQADVAKSLAEKAILFGYREDFGNDLDRLVKA